MSGFDPRHDEQLIVRERVKTRKPRRFKVVIHNDDFTTMEFVVEALMKYFHKTESEANRIMLEVHSRGQGIAGVYPYDLAQTKVAQVTDEARGQGMPLMCTIEPA